MVEISYRNLKNSGDETEASLIARLGVPGDSMVLAEVPVDLSGRQGTKSSTVVPGHAGESYRLNFLLNDELLASRTLRLSSRQ